MKKYDVNYFIKKFEAIPENKWTDEGFVVRLASGERIKFKSKEYLKMAKIKANMSPLTFWEKMKEGDKPFKEWYQTLPEEFRPEADKICWQLKDKMIELEMKLQELKRDTFGELFQQHYPDPTKENKKTLGLHLKAKPKKYGPTLFYFLDNNNEAITDFIFKEIRPTGNIINE